MPRIDVVTGFAALFLVMVAAPGLTLLSETWRVTPGTEDHQGGVNCDGHTGTAIVRTGDDLKITCEGWETWRVTPGTEDHRGGVNCDGHTGTVIVRTGDDLKITCQGIERPAFDGTDLISIRFDGTDADDCCWVQFVWGEVLQFRGNVSTAIPGTFDGTIELPLTTDPSAPNYQVDSVSDTDPCYGAGGTARTNSGRTIMWDGPDTNRMLALAPLTSGVTRVEAKLHFQTYLVCGGEICYSVSWESVSVFVVAAGGNTSTAPVTNTLVSASPGGSLDTRQQNALDEEYPDQDIISD